MSRVAIVGSRKFHHLSRVVAFVNSLPHDTIVVSGGAEGVDRAATISAELQGLTTHTYAPDWKRYGKAAGAIRNRAIVENADRVVAFWDGKSPGTRITIDFALKLGKPLEVHVV